MVMPMSQPRGEDWSRLASYVVSARLAAGYRDRKAFSEAIGINHRTLGKLELGQRVSPETLAEVERAVGWKPDSARMILNGGEPVPVAAPGNDRSEAIRQADEFLRNMSEADRLRLAEEFIAKIRSDAARDERQTGTGSGA